MSLAHICKPSYLGGRDQEDHGSRPTLVKKFTRPHLNRNGWAWWHKPIISATVGSTNTRTMIQASQAKSETLSQKQPKQKGLEAWLK
jgi:hypothetical protein